MKFQNDPAVQFFGLNDFVSLHAASMDPFHAVETLLSTASRAMSRRLSKALVEVN